MHRGGKGEKKGKQGKEYTVILQKSHSSVVIGAVDVARCAALVFAVTVAKAERGVIGLK